MLDQRTINCGLISTYSVLKTTFSKLHNVSKSFSLSFFKTYRNQYIFNGLSNSSVHKIRLKCLIFKCFQRLLATNQNMPFLRLKFPVHSRRILCICLRLQRRRISVSRPVSSIFWNFSSESSLPVHLLQFSYGMEGHFSYPRSQYTFLIFHYIRHAVSVHT